MNSLSSLSSGLRLQSLLQKEIQTILQQELDNESAILLYSTGSHWVAFEHSVYQLCRRTPEADLTPFFFDNYPFPVLMASIPVMDLGEKGLKEKMTLAAPKLNMRQYRAWHRREMKEFEDILN